MSFTPLGDALQDKMKQEQGLQGQLDAAKVVEAAEQALLEIFGEELAPHAKPLFLKNRTLTISCSTSAMAQEIRLNQAKIVDAVNKALGNKEVDRIRYLT